VKGSSNVSILTAENLLVFYGVFWVIALIIGAFDMVDKVSNLGDD
jgi:hypothetical protein